MAIKVVNKRKHTTTIHDIYVGRGSDLGNKYSHKEGTLAEFIVATRKEAIECYRKWLVNKIKSGDTSVLKALDRIRPDSILVCYCKPLACP